MSPAAPSSKLSEAFSTLLNGTWGLPDLISIKNGRWGDADLNSKYLRLWQWLCIQNFKAFTAEEKMFQSQLDTFCLYYTVTTVKP